LLFQVHAFHFIASFLVVAESTTHLATIGPFPYQGDHLPLRCPS
jgi:hypothetical protein